MVTKTFTCLNGHRWSDSDKCERCPICAAKAQETIGDGKSHHDSTENGTSPGGTTAPAKPESGEFGRYTIIDELGRGGMGIVYRVRDPVHERDVALKTLPNNDATLLSRFKREFRVVAGVDHPNIIRLFELSADSDNWFFTMEIVDGVDLMKYVGDLEISPTDDPDDLAVTQILTPREFPAEKLQRIGSAFSQLADAIGAMHAHGVVHRDIKPTNVVVTREGRVVLLDFGLVAETDPSGLYQSMHQSVMGTAAYMSPEQAACEAVSTASDWYAVGAMLYQALTGKLPFSGKPVDVLFNKQKRDPTQPRNINPAIPGQWNDLCMDLLSRKPEDRPPADVVLARMGGQTRLATTAHVPAPEVISLVGRESHLRTLHVGWQETRAGKPMSIFVEGRSGTGKSALVEAFIDQMAGADTLALKGRCYEMESVPFKAIDSLIDSLVDRLTHLSDADAAALMPRDVHALVRMFPVIGQVDAVAKLPRRQLEFTDQQELNRRAIAALRELLARMGDRYPLIVYIDDLQWGDEDSAAMLSDLLQPPDAPTLLFLGTYRSEDAETSQFLQSFWQIQRQREVPLRSQRIQIGPLEHDDSVRLALDLLGRDDEDARSSAESIARESSGNPFFVSELVKHLQLTGDQVSKFNEPLNLLDMIWSRVQLLPDDSQKLLAVIALWGQPLPLDRAINIADVGQSAVGPLRTGHLIRTVGVSTSSKIETYHDRVRESVSQCLETVDRKRHHMQIAEDCVRRSSTFAGEIMSRLNDYLADDSSQLDDLLDVETNWYDVALHFVSAGRADLAFPYALATAEKSRSQCSLEVAEQQYRIAQREFDRLDEMVRFRISEAFGDVLMLRGKYPEAKHEFEAALGLSREADSQARIEGKIGELAFKQGEMKTAIDPTERALQLLGYSVPKWWGDLFCRVAWEGGVQLLHTIAPKTFTSGRRSNAPRDQLIAIRLYDRLVYPYFFKRGTILCLWAHLRSMNLAERYGPTLELGKVYSTHAPVMHLVGQFERGIAYTEKSYSICESKGDLLGQGQSLHFQAHVLHAASRYRECIEKCRAAIRMLEQTGDYWEINVARYHIALCLYRLGDLADAAAEAKRMHESGLELGDIQASAGSLDPWVRATGGSVGREIVQRELNRERDDVLADAMVMLADGVQLFLQDRIDEASDVFQTAYSRAAAAGIKNVYVYPHLSWRASALRRKAEKLATSVQLSEILRCAVGVSRKALRIARKFQNDLPHALRETGLILALKGSERHAHKFLNESVQVAEQQGAKFEHAQSLLARGTLGAKFGWPDAESEIAGARQALIEMGAEFALEHLESPK